MLVVLLWQKISSELKQAEIQLKATNALLHFIINALLCRYQPVQNGACEVDALVDFEFVLVNEKGATYHNHSNLTDKCLFTEVPFVKDQLPTLADDVAEKGMAAGRTLHAAIKATNNDKL
jgi:hypothetical protein